VLREALKREREGSDRLQAERNAAATDLARERDRAENALIRAAAFEAEVKGLRDALEEARRPFWRRWLG
jgi:seryl-tRNA synthetase